MRAICFYSRAAPNKLGGQTVETGGVYIPRGGNSSRGNVGGECLAT